MAKKLSPVEQQQLLERFKKYVATCDKDPAAEAKLRRILSSIMLNAPLPRIQEIAELVSSQCDQDFLLIVGSN